jgi:lipoprotein signal peptidase
MLKKIIFILLILMLIIGVGLFLFAMMIKQTPSAELVALLILLLIIFGAFGSVMIYVTIDKIKESKKLDK